MPGSSDPPPERIVPLRHLKEFSISTKSSHSILLRHLYLPAGASLISEFQFHGEEFPLLDYLSAWSPNLGNLSHITTANLHFNSGDKYVRLSGPSGSLRAVALWGDREVPLSYAKDRELLLSLGQLALSAVQILAISGYGHPRPAEVEECPVFQTLSTVNDLRTLILTNCDGLPFILALDPEQNPSDLVLCVTLEELVIYTESWSLSKVELLIKMAKNRASRGSKLSSFTFVDLCGLDLREEVLKLREHAMHVEYRVDGAPPAWDDITGGSGGEKEQACEMVYR